MQILEALNAVATDLVETGLAKTQQNTHDKYNFRGIDDVYQVIGPLFAKHGIVPVPEWQEVRKTERRSAKGTPMFLADVKGYVHFYCIDGSKVSAFVFGEALDRGDKSVSKAASDAYKMAVLEVLCPPISGQPDSDSDSHELAPSELTADQAKQVRDLLAACGREETAMLQWLGAESIESMTVKQFEKAVQGMTPKAAA